MNDYSALAQRVSTSITGVRGCLMLSRDGMVLGAHPEGEQETHIRSSWMRFAAVGDPERSYVEFPDQVWAFVRRGGYSAFAVADTGVRPGVLVDLLEQALMVGEQDRARDRETLRLPEAPAAPSGKPRISMHKQERTATPAAVPSEVTSQTAAEGTVSDEPTGETLPSSAAEVVAPADPGAKAESEPSDPKNPTDRAGKADRGETPDRPEKKEEESEVDRILLAKEFAGLLQVPKEDDEASR